MSFGLQGWGDTLHRFPTSRSAWVLASVVATATLSWVAFANGGPILFPDTWNYISDGQAIVRHRWPGGARPIFYGLMIEVMDLEQTTWPVLLLQAGIVAHLIALTARVVGLALRPVQFAALAACVAALTPASWYAAHLMPDLFSGVLVLCYFALAYGREHMGRIETAYVFLLATASTCFHLTGFVTAGVLCLAIVCLRPVAGCGRPALPVAAFVLALGAQLSVSAVLSGKLSLSPKSPAHLMARLIADGPGRDYLEAACGREHYRICRDLTKLPETGDEILWHYMANLPASDHRTVREQEPAIVRGTIGMFPVQVAAQMALNAGRQLVTFGSGLSLGEGEWERLILDRPFLERDTRNTSQTLGLLTDRLLDYANLVHAGVILLSVLAGLAAMRTAVSRRLHRPALLLAIVTSALCANAFASGALSGVVGRYQGRVIWILPLVVVLTTLAVRQLRPRLDGHAAQSSGSVPLSAA